MAGAWRSFVTGMHTNEASYPKNKPQNKSLIFESFSGTAVSDLEHNAVNPIAQRTSIDIILSDTMKNWANKLVNRMIALSQEIVATLKPSDPYIKP